FNFNQPNNPQAIAFTDLIYKTFKIESSRNDTDAKIIHKNIVKCLGINFDERLQNAY
ncbi:hypothetical protein ALC53_05578, partial [Atta colombica]